MENGERGDIIQDVKFDNQDLSKALMIDCTSLCKISVYSNPEETEVFEVNQTANETENETEQTLENQTEVSTTAQENSFSIVSVGKSIFTKADGSLNIPIIILLGVFAVIIIVLIILRRPRRKRNKKNKEKEDLKKENLKNLKKKSRKKKKK
jgi:preprotein translocase subunit SecG